jgi:hypothetical protein
VKLGFRGDWLWTNRLSHGMALADMLVLLMVGIFEEHRWGGLQLHGIHTKCHEISQVYLQLIEGVQVSTWTK